MATAAQLRRRLVEELERSGAVSSDAVRDAFLRVPRERFLPGVPLETVYRDDVIVTKTDEQGMPISSSSQPQIMARMLEQLDLRPGLRVLEIGAGTGYNAALLKTLVGPGGRVVTVDVDAEIARAARRALRAGGHRATVLVGDGREGHAAGAPYDRIVATASTARIPRAWLDQLVEGGLLELPLRLSGMNGQAVATFRRSGSLLESVAVLAGGFMSLRGEEEPPLWLSANEDGRLLAQLSGPGLRGLSQAGRRRALALALGDPRRRALGFRWPAWSLGFYLGLELPPRRLVTRSPGFGIGVVGSGGRSLALLDVRPEGGDRPVPQRLLAWGEPEAERELLRVLGRWEQRGRPRETELELRVSFRGGGSRIARRWRRP